MKITNVRISYVHAFVDNEDQHHDTGIHAKVPAKEIPSFLNRICNSPSVQETLYHLRRSTSNDMGVMIIADVLGMENKLIFHDNRVSISGSWKDFRHQIQDEPQPAEIVEDFDCVSTADS